MKSIFKNGYFRQALTVVLTLAVTGLCAFAYQGLTAPSDDEIAEKYVNKEVYQIQQNTMNKSFDKIDKSFDKIDKRFDKMEDKQDEILKEIRSK